MRARRFDWFFLAAVAITAAGGIAWLAGARSAANGAWLAVTAMGLWAAAWWTVAALRAGRLAADSIAFLALAGTIVSHELLAGAVVAVMLASGRGLEARAASRAKREVAALVARAPRSGHRREGGEVVTVPIDELRPGDSVVVKPAEIVPVDGVVRSETAILDESALTGEPAPVRRSEGDTVRSGVVNAGQTFELHATSDARGSTYGEIVRLVASAEAGPSRFVRLADRYAAWLLVATVLLAGGAWVASGEFVRAVAVLVVATPCPLVLATPVAITSGLSRCARRGVIVKGGETLERLAAIDTVLVDKTGTLTVGHPVLTDVVAPDVPAGELLRLAASLDQVSSHPLARPIVSAARTRGFELAMPAGAVEQAGHGIRGVVGDRHVALGRLAWVSGAAPPVWAEPLRKEIDRSGRLAVYVAVDGAVAGALVLEDMLRPDAPATIRRLRLAGIKRIVMVTGDRREPAERVAGVVGVDAVQAEVTPKGKAETVQAERAGGALVAMVGDGLNDAPALAAADVGVAIGSTSVASAETSDVVLVSDRIDRLGEARLVAARARRVAAQSAVGGVVLAGIGMAAAAWGWLVPVLGAAAQEAIDVFAIANSLRARREPAQVVRLKGIGAEVGRRVQAEHRELWPQLARLRDVADHLEGPITAAQRAELRSIERFLSEDLLAHEKAEDRELYPAVAAALGGTDRTATMSRAHTEIETLVGEYQRLMSQLTGEDEDVSGLERSLRRVLYALDALLHLHFAQEDEHYLLLVDEG